MKKIRLATLVALVLTAVLAFSACGPKVVLTQLSPPGGLSAAEGADAVAWDAVTNAVGYVVSVNGAEKPQQTATSYNVGGLSDGKYTFMVKSIGDKKNYNDSAWSATLQCDVEGGKVTGSSGGGKEPDGLQSGEPLYGHALSQRIAGEGIVMMKNEIKNGVETIPLAANENKLAVFGWSATDGGFVMGGTGSGGGTGAGSVKLRKALEDTEAAAKAAYPTADPFGWNFECFGELFTIGSAFRTQRTIGGIDSGNFNRTFNLVEPTINDSVMNSARNFADVAVMVIGRLGGESMDLPTNLQYKQTTAGNQADPASTQQNDNTRHYLQLTTNEEALMSQIKAAGFKKFIVLLNVCNALQLDFVDDPAYGIDAVLHIGGPGGTGAYGVRRVLNGTIQASGKTVNTWVKDLKKEPSFVNAARTGVIGYSGGGNFIEYREDIYVGYRYYETAAKDGKIVYDDVVKYPFGFGLTNATFDWDVKSVSPGAGAAITADTKFKIQVAVKNTSAKWVGQDVVQVYVTAPYMQSGIEKPHVVLVAYAKTGVLYPASMANPEEKKYNEELLVLEFSAYEFASYDCYDANKNGFAGYELDAGAYEVKLMKDAHNVNAQTKGQAAGGIINYTCAGSKFDKDTKFTDLGGNERTLNAARNYFTNIPGKTEAEVPGAKSADEFYFGIPIDGRAGVNQTHGTGGGATMDTAALYNGNGIPLMSRQSFTLPAKAAARAKGYTVTGNNEKPGWNTAITVDAQGSRTLDWDETSAQAAKVGPVGQTGPLFIAQSNALTPLGRQLGSDFYDPQWDDLLDQMPANEMWQLVRDGNYITVAAPSVGKGRLYDLDGPSGLSGGPNRGFTLYPIETTLAQSWNRQLAYNFGIAVGKEGKDANRVGGWYAPACNIHRNAFEGRNFEYFSEDPFISGLMSADISYGARVHGVYTYVKHFVGNETETSRGGLRTWMTEQAFREIYLKPFEIAVRQGHATGIMNSFNFMGGIWTGGSVALQQNVVRGEWGFRGTICTDYFSGSGDWMNGDQGLRAGTDLWIGGHGANTPTTTGVQSNGNMPNNAPDATLMLLRRSAKNLLYSMANAWWYEETQGGYDKSYFSIIVDIPA